MSKEDTSSSLTIAEGVLIAVGIVIVLAAIVLLIRKLWYKPVSRLPSSVTWRQDGRVVQFDKGTTMSEMNDAIQDTLKKTPAVQELLRSA
jgi:hypothetical protein